MIHIVTPYSRPENVPALMRHLAAQGVALTWHPLVGSIAFPEDGAPDWVRPTQVDVPPGCDPFCYKLRAFVADGGIVDDERYGMLCDDDLYEDGVLAAVERMDAPIVVISMLRGQCVPARAANGYLHPTTPLTAAPEMMRPGAVGLQQCFVTGDIFRQLSIDTDRPDYCDGLAVQWLADTHGDSIRYEPGLNVLFNRLEPGRWAVDYDEVTQWRSN